MMKIEGDRLVIDGRECRFVPTPHQGARIEPALIVLHDTAGRLAPGSSVEWFQDPKAKASAHFVVERDGTIVQMVECDRMAWHAGKSEWQGRANVNGFAIGIEIVSPGKLLARGDQGVAWFGECFDGCVAVDSAAHGGPGLWLPYTPEQIAAVSGLVRALAIRYPTITDVVGHYEVSPGRKVDPGPHYPMEPLRRMLSARTAPEAETVRWAQGRLAELGYAPGSADGHMGPRCRNATRAFQEQNGLDLTGALDPDTTAALASDSAKEMPAGTRAEATPADLAAAGSGQVTDAWWVKRLGEVTALAAIVKSAGDAASDLTTWATSASGLTSIAIVAAALGVWWLGSRIEWRRVAEHARGLNLSR